MTHQIELLSLSGSAALSRWKFKPGDKVEWFQCGTFKKGIVVAQRPRKIYEDLGYQQLWAQEARRVCFDGQPVPATGFYLKKLKRIALNVSQDRYLIWVPWLNGDGRFVSPCKVTVEAAS